MTAQYRPLADLNNRKTVHQYLIHNIKLNIIQRCMTDKQTVKRERTLQGKGKRFTHKSALYCSYYYKNELYRLQDDPIAATV